MWSRRKESFEQSRALSVYNPVIFESRKTKTAAVHNSSTQCHEEVLYCLQFMIPSERFDFSRRSEGLDAFRNFFKFVLRRSDAARSFAKHHHHRDR